MLYIINYILQCDQDTEENINAFNGGNIIQFIVGDALIIPCGVSEVTDKVSNYENKNIIVKVLIPESVISIGNRAFKDCINLESISIPNCVSNIGEQAFSNCKNLQNVNIPTSLTELKGGIFSYCTSLKKIIIPSNIQQSSYISLENGSDIGPFSYSGLQQVVIQSGVTNIGKYMFFYCRNLVSVSIPNTVTQINWFAFLGCSSITFISIPNSVTIIKRQAFSGCTNLQTIVIPDSVVTIDQRAFSHCRSLSCVQIKSETCTIESNAFDETIYEGINDPTNFNSTCPVTMYTVCKNDSSDYHVLNSGKCVSEMYVMHYTVEDGVKYYQEQCPDTHQLSIEGSKQCFSECSDGYIQQNNQCVQKQDDDSKKLTSSQIVGIVIGVIVIIAIIVIVSIICIKKHKQDSNQTEVRHMTDKIMEDA